MRKSQFEISKHRLFDGIKSLNNSDRAANGDFNFRQHIVSIDTYERHLMHCDNKRTVFCEIGPKSEADFCHAECYDFEMGELCGPCAPCDEPFVFISEELVSDILSYIAPRDSSAENIDHHLLPTKFREAFNIRTKAELLLELFDDRDVKTAAHKVVDETDMVCNPFVAEYDPGPIHGRRFNLYIPENQASIIKDVGNMNIVMSNDYNEAAQRLLDSSRVDNHTICVSGAHIPRCVYERYICVIPLELGVRVTVTSLRVLEDGSRTMERECYIMEDGEWELAAEEPN